MLESAKRLTPRLPRLHPHLGYHQNVPHRQYSRARSVLGHSRASGGTGQWLSCRSDKTPYLGGLRKKYLCFFPWRIINVEDRRIKVTVVCQTRQTVWRYLVRHVIATRSARAQMHRCYKLVTSVEKSQATTFPG